MPVATTTKVQDTEARGQARAFRARVAAENDAYLKASWRLVEPIKARITRYPLRNFRPNTLTTFERDWRLNMPQVFSVDLVTEWPRHGVTIAERRIAVADFHDDGWTPDYQEPNVSISDVAVTLNRKTAKVKFTTRAIFSQRALTAWYRWTWDDSDAALIRNMVTVADCDAAALPGGDDYATIPVDGDGAGWRARTLDAELEAGRVEPVITVRDWWAG